MEVITNNIYLDAINKHRNVILSTQETLSRGKIVLLDFDVYSKSVHDQLIHSLFYVYKDNLPAYCSNRLKEFTHEPICIKHLDLCVLTSV
jgi:hypothetical protein